MSTGQRPKQRAIRPQAHRRRREVRRLLSSVAALSVAVPTSLLLVATPSQAATTARIVGGGYASAGVTYAKQYDSLTLSVSTDSNAECVVFRDGSSDTSPVMGSVYNGNKSASWTFTFSAGSGNGSRTVSATAYKSNSVGNKAVGTSDLDKCAGGLADSGGSAHSNVSYVLDNTPPSISGSHAPASGTPTAQDGWYRGDVVVSWTCTDNTGGAGLKAPGCPLPEAVTGEGNNLSRSGSVSDNVGNTVSASVGPINIDRTAPTTTANAPTGWQNGKVTVTLTPTDNLSGVESTEHSLDDGNTWASGTRIELGEGQHTLTYRSTDVAGNVEAAKTATVDIDLTAPTIKPTQDPAANLAGWNNTDVTASFICGDALSGIKSCTEPSTVTAEGSTDVTGTAVDNAANSTSFTHTVRIDKTKPTINGNADGTRGSNGWYTSDVTVAFTCSDPGSSMIPPTGSGIASCASRVTLDDEGAGQSVTGNAADAAGNANEATVSGIKIDKTAPSTTSDAPTGWQNEDVTVSFTAEDQVGLSGVQYTEYSKDGGRTWTQADSVTLGEGVHTVLFRSVDNAGNVEQASSAAVAVDTTDPTITGTTDREPVAGWYTADVTVSFGCEDLGSGLDGDCPEPVVLVEGGDQTVSRSVSDVAGNTASATVGPIHIDKTAPLTTANAPTGWQNGKVSVTLTAADNLSGPASTEYSLDRGQSWTSGASIELGEGRHTLTYRSTDVAGNVEVARTAMVDIDLTAPRITPGQNPVANTAGWNNTDVTVSFTCDDALSQVLSCTDPAVVTAEGATTVTGTAVDNAGNDSSVDHTVRIDKNDPTITETVHGSKGSNDWYTSDVGITFACDDRLSGIASCTGNTTLAEGANQSASGTAVDAAGNSAEAIVNGINIDTTAPTTASDAPTGWQNGAVTVTFASEDQVDLSGVQYTEYSRDGGRTWLQGTSVMLGDGTHALQFRSVDNAGNVEEAKSATVWVDLGAPTVTLTGANSTSDTSATLTGTAADTGGGLAGVTVNGETVTVATDGTFSHSVVLACGSNTLTAEATDEVGWKQSASHTVTRTCAAPVPTVVWSTQGFFAPVDMSTSTKKMINSVRGGSTVPLKFRVFKDGVEQKDVAMVSGMKVSAVACETGAVTGTMDQVTAGSTSLRYDGTQFIQNWKTPTTVGCYSASALLANGSAITADFKVTK